MTNDTLSTKIPPFSLKQAGSKALQAWYWDYLFVIVGAALVAMGIVFFIVPFKFIPGGVIGISILVHQLTGWPVGIIALGINIPLLIWGIRVLGAHFGAKTIIAMVLSSLFIDLLQEILHVPQITKDVLVGSVFGGVLIGAGVALVMRGGATTGGTDIIAQVFSKYTKIAVGKLFLVVDGLIVLSGILVFKDIDSAPYAVITIFVISRTIDYMVAGFDNRKAVFVISDMHDKIREYILNNLDRTGTYLLGKGLYFEAQEKKIILTALTRKELVRLQNYIVMTDPKAFVMALNTNEVFGSGFRDLSK